MDICRLLEQNPVLARVAKAEEVFWANPRCGERPPAEEAVSPEEIEGAEDRLQRFAPYLARVFPETAATGGLIESPLRAAPRMEQALRDRGEMPAGRLLLKLDSELAVAGSIKARGGIYEVLCHAEELALRCGILRPGDCYDKLLTARDFFSRYTVQVGSTGNLGLSIGIMSAALGFHTVVHMSADARQWKKDLLRQKGVEVREYAGDYAAAVASGREASLQDPHSYFVDDEHSKNLFLGYAVAALRLQSQLARQGILVDEEHPLFVTVPCGVGGAPGGITYGLKAILGENVHCLFVEPVAAPAVLAGLASGLGERISAKDLGLSGRTQADGLAVCRPSGLVCPLMETRVSGVVTVQDARLYQYLQLLYQTEDIFVEPSAAAGFAGPAALAGEEGRALLRRLGLEGRMERASHIIWTTGGRLVPPEIRQDYLFYGR